LEADMARGGARSRSGPPPDPASLTSTEGDWTVLPAEGRPGDPPPWPMVEVLERELDIWADLWSSPQAVMWEREGQEFTVALYVRRLVEAEKHDSKVNLSTLVKQLGEGLGLTSPGMRSNRWKIAPEKPADDTAGPVVPSARERFTVVAGGGA